MEPSGRNQSQPVADHAAPKTAEAGATVAVGCDRLPRKRHGDGVGCQGVAITNQCCKLTIRVEQIGRVVAGAVVAIARSAVGSEAGLGSRAVELVDLLLGARVEAQVQVLRASPAACSPR
jgi:hypothetical protein